MMTVFVLSGSACADQHVVSVDEIKKCRNKGGRPLRRRVPGELVSGEAGRVSDSRGSIEAARPATGRAWLIVALLFMFMFISYADKIVLTLAGPRIIDELQLTKTQFGDLGSSFFLLYAVSSVAFGFAANRLPSRWLLLGMGLVWAAIQFPMVGTVGLGTLVTCRILLGASEGPGLPVALHAAYKWFDDTKRTLPTSLLVLGAGVGTAVSGLVLPPIIEHWSWHEAFLAVGLAGLVWSLAWFLLGGEGPLRDEADLIGETVAYRHLLLNRTALGVFLVSFVAYWGVAMGLVWCTVYFVKVGGLSLIAAGRVATQPLLVSIVLGPAIAFLSQRLVRRGVPTRFSRGAFGCAGVVLGACGIASMALATEPLTKILCYTFAASMMFIIFTLGPTIIAEITPLRQRAAMLAINNAIYSTAGILAPAIAGRVIDAAPDPLTGYRDGYLLLALLLATGGVVGFLLIDPARDTKRLAEPGPTQTGAAPLIA
jgi:MFS family permease